MSHCSPGQHAVQVSPGAVKQSLRRADGGARRFDLFGTRASHELIALRASRLYGRLGLRSLGQQHRVVHAKEHIAFAHDRALVGVYLRHQPPISDAILTSRAAILPDALSPLRWPRWPEGLARGQCDQQRDEQKTAKERLSM